MSLGLPFQEICPFNKPNLLNLKKKKKFSEVFTVLINIHKMFF